MTVEIKLPGYMVCPFCKGKIILEYPEKKNWALTKDMLYMGTINDLIKIDRGLPHRSRQTKGWGMTFCKHCKAVLGSSH
ncbi:MAG: hypothetical protein ACFFCS_10390 [Candidatus Hodarchaeota archaeon]